MKRVYVCGPYSCEGRCEPLGIDLTNMARGITVCATLLRGGYAPFCPWLDFLFVIAPGGDRITRQQFYDYSLAWLEKADAVYCLDLRMSSIGTLAEIHHAQQLGIPVYHSLGDLLEGCPVD